MRNSISNFVAILSVNIFLFHFNAVAEVRVKLTQTITAHISGVKVIRGTGLRTACLRTATGRQLFGSLSGKYFISPVNISSHLRAAERKLLHTLAARCTTRSPTPTVTPRTILTIPPTSTPNATLTPTATATATATTTTTPTATPTAFVSAPPNLALWEQNMISYGRTHCSNLTNASLTFDQKLLNTYYDAEWVFFQIGDYTHDSSWYACAQAAEQIYRDQYAIPNNGQLPGYWLFTHGIAQDYLRNGDQNSSGADILISLNGSYAPDLTPLSWTADSTMSREVAYNMMSFMNAEDLGAPRRTRLLNLKQQALSHLDQWFVLHNAPYTRPFMVSLTAHALIMYDERIGDPAIVPALVKAADTMWNTLWLPGAHAFKYTDVDTSLFSPTTFGYNTGGTEPAPDLNLLIAPMYAWLYHKTGEIRFLNEADAIFSGGVTQAYLTNAKQFNQNYRLSFEYLRWRSQPPM